MVLFQNKLSLNTPKTAGSYSSGNWEGGGLGARCAPTCLTGPGAAHMAWPRRWGTSSDLSQQLLHNVVANRNMERHQVPS